MPKEIRSVGFGRAPVGLPPGARLQTIRAVACQVFKGLDEPKEIKALRGERDASATATICSAIATQAPHRSVKITCQGRTVLRNSNYVKANLFTAENLHDNRQTAAYATQRSPWHPRSQMEPEDLRRRLGILKPVPSSPAATDSLRPKGERLATPASPKPSSPKTRGDEANSSEPILQQALETLSISEPVEAQPKLVEAVDKVFRPVEKFRDHFARLARLFEPIGEASQSTLDAFKKIGGLQNHLVELRRTFQSVGTFIDQMGKFAERFEPMKPLYHELTQFNDAFRADLLDLVKALEPVDALKARTAQLFEALDSIAELQARLKEVAKTFCPTAKSAP